MTMHEKRMARRAIMDGKGVVTTSEGFGTITGRVSGSVPNLANEPTKIGVDAMEPKEVAEGLKAGKSATKYKKDTYDSCGVSKKAIDLVKTGNFVDGVLQDSVNSTITTKAIASGLLARDGKHKGTGRIKFVLTEMGGILRGKDKQ